jgi:hypothetical protein
MSQSECNMSCHDDPEFPEPDLPDDVPTRVGEHVTIEFESDYFPGVPKVRKFEIIRINSNHGFVVRPISEDDRYDVEFLPVTQIYWGFDRGWTEIIWWQEQQRFMHNSGLSVTFHKTSQKSIDAVAPATAPVVSKPAESVDSFSTALSSGLDASSDVSIAPTKATSQSQKRSSVEACNKCEYVGQKCNGCTWVCRFMPFVDTPSRDQLNRYSVPCGRCGYKGHNCGGCPFKPTTCPDSP